jgi:uncharacterized coiled-coil protein SlyX
VQDHVAEPQTPLARVQDHVAELQTPLARVQDHVAELQTPLAPFQNLQIAIKSNKIPPSSHYQNSQISIHHS